MTVAVAVVVVVGVAASVVAGLAVGMDALGLVLLAFIVCLGGLAIALPAKLKAGGVRPVRCDECGGVLSAAAPYCKHCGKRISSEVFGRDPPA